MLRSLFSSSLLRSSKAVLSCTSPASRRAPLSPFSTSSRFFSSDSTNSTTTATTQDTATTTAQNSSSNNNNNNNSNSNNSSSTSSTAALEAKVKELDEARKDLQDRYLRSLADNKNQAMRAAADLEAAKKFSLSGFSKSLVEIVDDLERCLEHTSKNNQAEIAQSKPFKDLVDGVSMTHKVLLKVLGQNGIEVMQPLGEKFDPNFHMALCEIPDPTKPPGTVKEVSKKGYTIHGRILRPAQVMITKAAVPPMATHPAGEGAVMPDLDGTK
eukprot:gnl/Hemi2/16163_TR5366_c0_g1_i1.p1 gnl/Hemi2/16163_TR5366_c0_g1~~gnl/Hemi2/16163_TR5366_c0_g1_i1.p1  ORF type:complete len:299 (+),score=84.08 gnl/Hemi2/16163_TR5366_c0_g1_i1:89-898(+)